MPVESTVALTFRLEELVVRLTLRRVGADLEADNRLGVALARPRVDVSREAGLIAVGDALTLVVRRLVVSGASTRVALLPADVRLVEAA